MLVAQSSVLTMNDPNPNQTELDSACSIFLSADESHRVLETSSGFVDLFGFSTCELQRSLRRMTGPQTDTKTFPDFIQSCSHSGFPEIPITLYRKDGYEVHCLLRRVERLFEGSAAICLCFIQLDRRHGCSAWDIDHDQIRLNVASPAASLAWNGTTAVQNETSGNVPPIDRAVLLHMKAIERSKKIKDDQLPGCS